MKRAISSRTALIAACLASAALAAACASIAPTEPLAGSRWSAVSIGGQPVLSRTPTIEFAADRISGTGGCNRYFGIYNVEGDTLTIGDVGSTEMACEPAIMRQEAGFFAALNAARAYSREGAQLTLSSADGHEIVLRTTP